MWDTSILRMGLTTCDDRKILVRKGISHDSVLQLNLVFIADTALSWEYVPSSFAGETRHVYASFPDS